MDCRTEWEGQKNQPVIKYNILGTQERSTYPDWAESWSKRGNKAEKHSQVKAKPWTHMWWGDISPLDHNNRQWIWRHSPQLLRRTASFTPPSGRFYLNGKEEERDRGERRGKWGQEATWVCTHWKVAKVETTSRSSSLPFSVRGLQACVLGHLVVCSSATLPLSVRRGTLCSPC